MSPVESKQGNIKNKLVSLAVQFVVLVVIYAGIQLYFKRDMPSGKAPDISGEMLDGGRFSLSESANQPVLIHFWATWCRICQFEHSTIDAIAEDYAVVTVATQSGSEPDVRDYVVEHKITAPVMVDEYGSLSKIYGVKAFPTTFVLNPDGSISNIEVGYTSEWGLRFRLWLSSL